jgi:hypothetical protein
MIRKTALPGGALCARAQDLPVTAAETLDGKKLEFPTALVGSISTCVFGFGKDSLTSDSVNAWSVVNVETTPAVARSTIRMSMRRGTFSASIGDELKARIAGLKGH